MIASEPDSLLSAWLAEQAAEAGATGIVHVARSEARAGRVARAVRALEPGLEVLLLPAWDCLPYDRASPSRAIMGARMAVLARLSRPSAGPRLLVASVEALGQRLPPAEATAGLALRLGDPFDEERIGRALTRLGYVFDDRVDEPGEAALHGAVLDVFPPGEDTLPCRVEYAEGRITAMRRYDPLTQRGAEEEAELLLLPASEAILPEAAEEEREPGLEHALPELYERLTPPLDLLPGAMLVLDPEVEALRGAREAEVTDAYRTRLALTPPTETARRPPEPARLFLDKADWAAALEGRRVITLAEPEADAEGAGMLPAFTEAEDPAEAFLDHVQERLAAGGRVALAGGGGQRGRTLARLAAGRLGAPPVPLAGWLALRASPPGTLGLLQGALDAGFATGGDAVIAPGDVRPAPARAPGPARATVLPGSGPGLQPGDAVIHLDHGLGVLRGVETVELGGASLDCLRLEYAGGNMQLVPLDEMDRLWRYGAEAEGLALDRLNGEAWTERRAMVEAQIAETAAELARLARRREARKAAPLRPPRSPFSRFEARFPFAPTPDQADAIAAVLADLASGRPMDRLVCGDVGYGKTEVALRAAAAAALAGRQVALMAPTTVLVRQHLEGFRRRFAGTGLRVEQLSRLSTPAEAREVKAGLADGSVRIVVGTQALAARSVRFKELGLLIVDEEQRFGASQKAALRRLAEGVHFMALTATPIPRTLQLALVGLQDLSVIATPPARRQPIRTTHVVLDDVVLRQALMREHRRGGQSFVVCARIEDLPAMRERIARLLPALSVTEAHGGMPAAEADAALLRFAGGACDVLLSTNIVETGLDVPRANTMLVWRADRFGLGQLHQLRGRVGRGRTRGTIYLLTDPAEPLSPATLKRLRTLEAFDRIGAGFTISARDMDLRGAGDLLGESQAGHLRLIGVELYQHLLGRALRAARGEAVPEDWTPRLVADMPAFIPESYVEEEALRVELHARLGEILRQEDGGGAEHALEELSGEIADRFGPPPEPVGNLLSLARLRIRCRRAGVAELKVGPSAAAATFRDSVPAAGPPLERKGERLVLRRESQDAAGMLAAAAGLLDRLPRRAPGPARAPRGKAGGAAPERAEAGRALQEAGQEG
ncbi:DEAD/DEAH box helicase [Pseudoroseomonas rhizosphaerae]|uniref:Transcription-repair-coupling factor n=1 Tax=Teichococcus rhizosphaerae TaxID=1335062 RepID=A0A2C6Z4Q9_9PROT|nr:DEAD/DEAH box helicase [Pseudoroseomonas rhizosphaerae]PHK93491.1 DEAD/DEAH box helicase [Pseudoroseomonas rhizosphaerae]